MPQTAAFDADEFDTRWRVRHDRHVLYSELLRRCRSAESYLPLEYKEIIPEGGIKRVFRFLEVSPDAEIKPVYQKQNSSDILSRFSNPDAAKRYLEKIGRMDWATEATP
jgi:hypothetical protein